MAVYSDREQIVVKSIQVLPLINGLPLRVLRVNPHVIMKHSIAAQISKAQFLAAKLELALPLRLQSFLGSTGAHRKPERRRMGSLDLLAICRNQSGFWRGRQCFDRLHSLNQPDGYQYGT